MVSADASSYLVIAIPYVRFEGVERADATDRFLGHRAGAGFVRIDKHASRMRPAIQLGNAVFEQRLVAGVGVDHQCAFPRAEEVGGVAAGAAGTVVEHDNRWIAGPSIREQVGAPGLAGTRIELGDRGLVGVQDGRCPELGLQGIDQQLQPQADHADPLGQCGARGFNPRAREDRFLSIQRKVIRILLDDNLSQQAFGHTYRNRRRRSVVAGLH